MLRYIQSLKKYPFKLTLCGVLFCALCVCVFCIPDKTHQTIYQHFSNFENSSSRDFQEITMDEALEYFDSNGNDVILYFGYDACPFCKRAGSYVLGVANEFNMNYKVRYVKTRDTFKKLTYSDSQRKVLAKYMKKYMSKNEDGKLWLYVPTLVRVKNGKAIEGCTGLVKGYNPDNKPTKEQDKKIYKNYKRVFLAE